VDGGAKDCRSRIIVLGQGQQQDQSLQISNMHRLRSLTLKREGREKIADVCTR